MQPERETAMKRMWNVVVFVALCARPAYAQTDLTDQQRIQDLDQLATLFAKHYAAYEWKRDVIGFDLLRLNPWLQDIHKQDDLDFEETLIDYVASLNDAHDSIIFPSNFTANLPLTVDLYDGKVLVDNIDRTLLPKAQFPFTIGDELVLLDGVPINGALESLYKYSVLANSRSTARLAAGQLTSRSQQFLPHAGDVADTAFLTIRLAATGQLQTYEIPWIKRGFPRLSTGTAPVPGRKPYREDNNPPTKTNLGPGHVTPSDFHRPRNAIVDDSLPDYMRPLAPFLNGVTASDDMGYINWGAKSPVFALPPGFVLRRGAASTDFFLTGTYVANGARIGFLRIPNEAPPSVTTALQQLDAEMAYFNANTDGLIVDVMNNSGGSLSFAESILQRLIPTPFHTMGFEIRPTPDWLSGFAEMLTRAEETNAPAGVIQNLQMIFDEVRRAAEQGGRTMPVSLNSTGSLTLTPKANAYQKPLLLLTDELTLSAGDMIAAVIQDNNRGPLFGMRTVGAGGSVVLYDATANTNAQVSITVSLMNRGRLVQTPEFPPTPYIENVGVRPNIVNDYMTRTNLLAGGAAYVQAFTAALLSLIQP